MGRGGKASSKGQFKKRVKDYGSDDSDEDYVASDEENVVSEDDLEDYCSSLDGDASESFDAEEEVEEEEEGEEEEEVKKVVRLKAKKGNLGNGRFGDKTSRKRKRVSYGEYEDYEEEEDEDEDEDEEFTPYEDDDEDDCLYEEEELVIAKRKNNNVKKKRNPGKKGSRKKVAARGRKKRKSTVSKKPLGKKVRRNRRLRKKERCEDDDDDDDYDSDFMDNSPVAREKSKKNSGRRKRKHVVPSDSDFVSSGSSDYEYTISEEEREQVREANELCGRLEATMRRSSCSKKTEEDGNVEQQRKPPVRKGKEKIEEVKKNEGGKQVCRICLSEEEKRRLRGTLNCCSHYFCFTCIMEWSKVESRCPLCKQRFQTITKPERSTGGVDLRSVVIPVPKRDQVYQPTEEDLMSYLDPYENVLCSECHQGGDDGLMLLCDICDSPAHTYCVGLGRDVPDGNWYCYGCRPVAVGSTSTQSQDPLPDQRTTNNLYNRPSPILSFGEGFDSSSVPSPRISINQGVGNLSSPRFTVGDVQAASPGSGAGALTLEGRRWLHRHIQNLLSINRTNLMAGSSDGMATANMSSGFLNSQIDQGRETIVQPARPQNVESSSQTIFEERLQENFLSSVQNTEIVASRLSHSRRQAVQDPSITSANGAVDMTLWPGLAVVNSVPPYEQFLQRSSIPNIRSDGCAPPIAAIKEEGDFYLDKEQLQSLIKSHLKNLSQDVELDNSTLKDIVRSSTHTILAACGLEHKGSEVQVVHPPTICSHVERLAAGQTSLMKGFCSSCFDSFVRDVVKRIMDPTLPQWLSLGL